MLDIKNLNVFIEQQQILKNCSLEVKPGEVHAIMGPNGSGKTTLGKVLSGDPGYEVRSGEISLCGEDLLEMEAHERAHKGLFLGFQYPVEIAGVSNIQFLKLALNSIRKAKNLPEVDAIDFLAEIKATAKKLGFAEDMLSRSVNDGFSGGEKKRNEILQMHILKPKIAILDEIDSGLDIDALKDIAKGIKDYVSSETAVIIITHYQRVLDFIKPDKVHIFLQGKIAKSGNAELANELEAKGYKNF